MSRQAPNYAVSALADLPVRPSWAEGGIIEVQGGSARQANTVQVDIPITEVTDLQQEVARLRDEVAALRQQVAAATARIVMIATLDSDKYALRRALPVQVEVTPEGVVAHAFDLEIYGAGESEYEALAELRRILVDEYEYLMDREQVLGPGPISQLRRMREMLEESA